MTSELLERLDRFQIEDVRQYFDALRRLRGETWNALDIPDDVLTLSTDLYCRIHTEGGGNPTLTAEMTLKKMTLSGRFSRASKAYPDYWLDKERHWN